MPGHSCMKSATAPGHSPVTASQTVITMSTLRIQPPLLKPQGLKRHPLQAPAFTLVCHVGHAEPIAPRRCRRRQMLLSERRSCLRHAMMAAEAAPVAIATPARAVRGKESPVFGILDPDELDEVFC